MTENRLSQISPLRRWSDQPQGMGRQETDARELLRALRRRKRIVLAAFAVAALAFVTVFKYRHSHQAVCLVAVKKPSQVFIPMVQTGAALSTSAPVLEGQTYKEMVEGMAFADKVSRALAPSGIRYTADEMGSRIKASFRDPDLLLIIGRDKDPSTAIRIANTAGQTLVDLNRSELRTELEAQVKSTAELREQAYQDVLGALTALVSYMQQEGIASSDLSSSSADYFRGMDVIVEHEVSRGKEMAALRTAEERLKALKVQKGATVDMQAVPAEDPAVKTVRAHAEEIRVKLLDAKKHFTDAHPLVKDLEAQMEAVRRELSAQAKAGKGRRAFNPSAEQELALRQMILETNQEIAARKAQIDVWTRLIDHRRADFARVSGKRAELERRRHVVQTAEDRYRSLSHRLDESRISLDAIKGTLSIVQPAVETEPPNTKKMAALGLLLLIVLPVGIGLGVDYVDNTVKNSSVLVRQVGLPCLATVPKSKSLAAPRVLEPSSNSVATFDILRAGVWLAAGDQPVKNIAVVSSKHNEGRSTTILNLARSLASENKRVTIVDTDLHSATDFAGLLGVENRGGLVEVLAGEKSLDEVLVEADVIKVFVLPNKGKGNMLPPNSGLLFRTPRFRQLVQDLRGANDVVLFDTSPILEFADTLEMLPNMDGVLLVAESGGTTPEEIQRTMDYVRFSGVRTLGLVLNKVQ